MQRAAPHRAARGAVWRRNLVFSQRTGGARHTEALPVNSVALANFMGVFVKYGK
jgi:hypothetical protein